MKKAAIIAAPLAVMLFFPLLLLVAVAGVGGINQAVACTTAVGSSGGGDFGIGTLNWRGASHYKKNPHPGEQPYSTRVPNMVAKINASGASIIGFQEFEPPQAQAFLDATHGQWALARGRVHGHADARDAIAYQPSAWTVAETRYVQINYGGTPEDIPLVRFSSTTGIGDVWVLNTHNPADVVNGSNALRDSAVRAEAKALRQQQASDPATPLFLTGDMNDKARFKQLFLSLAPGWSTANPTAKQIDWIMGSPGVTFTGTVVDRSTNDNAHAYTDHPFVHTTATVAAAGGTTGANSASGGNAHGGGGAVAGDPQAQGGQVGSGEQLGVLPVVRNAQPGQPMQGIVKMTAANLPQSHIGGRAGAIRTIAAAQPDFIALNEVSTWSAGQLASAAPGYGAYKDPATNIHYAGGANSMENAVMWDAAKWHLVDAGRYMYVEHDLVMFKGKPVDWNRYATWTILRRASDGAQVVVISTHNMTNPQVQRRTHGNYQWPSRVAQYADGMKKLRALVVQLAAYGPVLMAGDMNVHPNQGAWSAPDQMAQNGFGYSFDRAVIYQFFPHGTRDVGERLISVDSDHPHALLTSIDLNGVGANATSGTPPGSAGQGSFEPVGDTGSGGCQPCPTGTGSDAITLTSASTGPLHDAEVAAAAAYQAGFRGNDLYTMVWIAGGESSYNTHAMNHYSSGGHTYYVYGLWQISSIHAGVSVPGIYDPLTNARQAFALYLGRGGSKLGDGGPATRFDDWSAHTAANETKYGATARQAIAAVAGGIIPAVATCNTSSNLPAGMTGSGNFTPNTSVAYVGPYSPGELVARMQKIMARNGSGGNLDPFFGTEPDGSWYHDCQHFVANLDGRSSSGYTSAASAWSHFLATGAAHPAGSSDGMSPPAGAWLYYGDNHVVVYLGNNLVAGTDTWGNGTAKIGPAADVQKWLASQGGYKGWVVPWGAPVKSSFAA
jgi:endonuclease/exonuclease/phosphatase family metal-dependent hydrolase